MGIFKGIKDMKQMVAAAPGMVEQAQMMGAQAQQLQYAQQQVAAQQQQQAMTAAQAAGVAPVAGGDVYAPIAGVTVEQYVAVVKGIAAYDYDQNMCAPLAAQRNIDRANWDQAAAGFNARITTNPAFAQHFNTLYRQA